jgi:hypothetical protein
MSGIKKRYCFWCGKVGLIIEKIDSNSEIVYKCYCSECHKIELIEMTKMWDIIYYYLYKMDENENEIEEMYKEISEIQDIFKNK